LSSYKNTYAGNFGDAGAFSFFATKSITSGEGGMITAKNKKLYFKMKSLTSYGMSQNYGNYDYKYFGSNYRMNEMEAILGYHFLNNFKDYKIEKQKIKNFYDKYLSNKISRFRTKTNNNLYKYICILKNSKLKKKLKIFLSKYNVQLSGDVYSKPLHKFKIIKAENNVKLENSSDICARHICLPIYLGIKKKEIYKVTRLLNKFITVNYK